MYVQHAYISVMLVAATLWVGCVAPDETGDVLDADDQGQLDTGLAWPNEHSKTNSDRWLIANHDHIQKLRPKVWVVNFSNIKSITAVHAIVNQFKAKLATASKYKGYDRAQAGPQLDMVIDKVIDLRDGPNAYPHSNNSKLYPKDMGASGPKKQGNWGFDYGALFSSTFARHFGVRATRAPYPPVPLCELISQGELNELWIVAESEEEFNAAEVLSITPNYTDYFVRRDGYSNSGNGSFDADDPLPLSCQKVGFRIVMINPQRSAGCALHSYGHGIEGVGGSAAIPYLNQYFKHFADMNLSERYGVADANGEPVRSWLKCSYDKNLPDCLTYVGDNRVSWKFYDNEDQPIGQGTIANYVPACGNVHFPPNARRHYDTASTRRILSTCRDFMQKSNGGTDEATHLSAYDWSPNLDSATANDCQADWVTWWMQNIPGYNNASLDKNRAKMKNWWVFLYY